MQKANLFNEGHELKSVSNSVEEEDVGKKYLAAQVTEHEHSSGGEALHHKQ